MTRVYSKDQIASRSTFSAHDLDEIARTRRGHNRLGFAYQLAFVKLSGTFPPQQNLEIIPDLLLFVSGQLDMGPQELKKYAKRRPTVTEHQDRIRVYLGLKRFQETEREALETYLLQEAWHLEQAAALFEKAEQWLQTEAILIPAADTLRRIIGEQRDRARNQVFAQVLAQLSELQRHQLDTLLLVEEEKRSPLQKLKDPAGQASISSIHRLIGKLEILEKTGVLAVDLSWLNHNLQKSLARKAQHYKIGRLKELLPAHRYTLLVCFLWQVYQETLAQMGDSLDKLLTRYYNTAKKELDEELKARRQALKGVMALFCDLSGAILDPAISDEDLRKACFAIVSQDALAQKQAEVQGWILGDAGDVFVRVTHKYSSLRKFAPQLLAKLPLESSTEGSQLLEAVSLLRDLNSENKRNVPDTAPLDFIPKRLQRLVKTGTEIDRHAYEVAVMTAVRDAGFVLDGLLYHESDLEIEEHYVDTHGYTEVNFAAFAMYGRRFCPRIRGLKHQRIYKIDDQLDYGKLAPMLTKPGVKVNLDRICENWDRMGHFYSSLEQGHATASLALQRLVSFGPKNDFYKANRDLGRIFKTEFILEYLSDPSLRRRTQRGLLKGEQLHALARQVSYGKQGKITGRDLHAHLNQANCLTLILGCIVFWQAKEITRLLEEHAPELEHLDLSLLSHISPIGWDNVTLYGDYIFDQNLIVPPENSSQR